LTNTGALPSACCVRWDQPNGWDRRCWRVVDVFELCLRVTVFHLDIVGNLSAQHFAPFIETIDWNQASAFLESLPVRWCGIDGFNPGVYGLVRNLFIPSTMME